MYQAVLRFLVGSLVLALLLGTFNKIAFDEFAILQTTVLALIFCYIFQRIFERIFRVAGNKESWLITALIIALIVGPSNVEDIWLPLGTAAAAAIGSKFLLTWHKRHIFNPAAFGIVVMAITLGTGSSWWIGTMPFSLLTVIGGLLIAYKIRRVSSVMVFLAVYLIGFIGLNSTELSLTTNLELVRALLLDTPLLFFASIMLIEPATSPTGRRNRVLYAAAVAAGIVSVQRFWPGIQFSFELVLLGGNGLTRLVERGGSLPVTLVKREKLTESIESFFFETSPKLNFTPGQFLEWTVPHANPDSRGIRRWFTIASSPTEPYLQLTTRFAEKSSTLKSAMRQLQPGQQISAHGLEGDFVLPADKTAAIVMIAGGIGITPFRSMIRFLLDRGEARDITLIYAVRQAEDLVFMDVFEQAQRAFGLKLVPVVAEGSASWQGKVGRIEKQLLNAEAPEINHSEVYISGPEPMVEALSGVVRELGTPNSAIHQDFFPGYDASDATRQ